LLSNSEIDVNIFIKHIINNPVRIKKINVFSYLALNQSIGLEFWIKYVKTLENDIAQYQSEHCLYPVLIDNKLAASDTQFIIDHVFSYDISEISWYAIFENQNLKPEFWDYVFEQEDLIRNLHLE